MNLYWVETPDHHEDWFVVAKSPQEASAFHESYEGYDKGDAAATLVLQIPEGVTEKTDWPSDEILVTCGARFVSAETPRVVEIAGKTYCEGALEQTIRQLSDDAFEAKGRGRLNKTRRNKGVS